MITIPIHIVDYINCYTKTIKVDMLYGKIISPLDVVAYQIIHFCSDERYHFVMPDGSIEVCYEYIVVEFIANNPELIRSIDTFEEIVQLAKL